MFGPFNFLGLRQFLREQRGSWREVRDGLRKRWFLSCGMIASAAACVVMLRHLDSLDRSRFRRQRTERPARRVAADDRRAVSVPEVPPEEIAELEKTSQDWEAVLAAHRRMWPDDSGHRDSAGQADAHQSAWTLIREDVEMDDNPFVSPADFSTTEETDRPPSAR